MNQIERGATIIKEIANVLNGIILSTGEAIDINNKDIWDPYLHTWTNEDWYDILAAYEGINMVYPDAIKTFHDDAYLVVKEIMRKNDLVKHRPRILDKKENKKYAWKMIMALREIYNSLNDIEIPNKPSKFKPTNNYNDLFE